MKMSLTFVNSLIILIQNCGVQSWENIAFNKTATQSSTYSGAIGQLVAQFAVDGNLEQIFTNCPCCALTVTGYGIKNPWWKVDLEEEYEVKSITIYKRADCCRE